MRNEHTESQSAQCLLSKLLYDERGAETAEYIVFLFVMLLLLAGLSFGASRIPNFLDKSLLVAVFSAIVGSMAWSVKQAIETQHRRAELFVLELLSDGEAYSRNQIASFLRKEHLIFRFMPLHLDAIADLVIAGKIVLFNGRYEARIKPKRRIITPSSDTE